MPTKFGLPPVIEVPPITVAAIASISIKIPKAIGSALDTLPASNMPAIAVSRLQIT